MRYILSIFLSVMAFNGMRAFATQPKSCVDKLENGSAKIYRFEDYRSTQPTDRTPSEHQGKTTRPHTLKQIFSLTSERKKLIEKFVDHPSINGLYGLLIHLLPNSAFNNHKNYSAQVGVYELNNGSDGFGIIISKGPHIKSVFRVLPGYNLQRISSAKFRKNHLRVRVVDQGMPDFAGRRRTRHAFEQELNLIYDSTGKLRRITLRDRGWLESLWQKGSIYPSHLTLSRVANEP